MQEFEEEVLWEGWNVSSVCTSSFEVCEGEWLPNKKKILSIWLVQSLKFQLVGLGLGELHQIARDLPIRVSTFPLHLYFLEHSLTHEWQVDLAIGMKSSSCPPRESL